MAVKVWRGDGREKAVLVRLDDDVIRTGLNVPSVAVNLKRG